MADKNKIKVAVRVRPFNRRGKFFFLVLFVLLNLFKKIFGGFLLETKK